MRSTVLANGDNKLPRLTWMLQWGQQDLQCVGGRSMVQQDALSSVMCQLPLHAEQQQPWHACALELTCSRSSLAGEAASR